MKCLPKRHLTWTLAVSGFRVHVTGASLAGEAGLSAQLQLLLEELRPEAAGRVRSVKGLVLFGVDGKAQRKFSFLGLANLQDNACDRGRVNSCLGFILFGCILVFPCVINKLPERRILGRNGEVAPRIEVDARGTSAY